MSSSTTAGVSHTLSVPGPRPGQCTGLQLCLSPQLVVVASVALALLLCGCMMHFWRKTQSLEYKYMKLVQSSGGRDGEDAEADSCELPPAESCALGEGEEEDVAFSAPSSQGLLNRIKAMRNKVRNHQGRSKAATACACASQGGFTCV